MRIVYWRRSLVLSFVFGYSLIIILIFNLKCRAIKENIVPDNRRSYLTSTKQISIDASTIPSKYLVVPYFEFVMRTSITCRINKLDSPKKDLNNLHPKYSKYLKGPFHYVLPSINITFEDVENFYLKILPKKANGQTIETLFAKNITFDNVPYTFKNGLWYPNGVISAQRTAIIVPLQGRDYNAKAFLFNMHAFLRQQQLTYTIVIVEQVAPSHPKFNKGRLYNAAVNYLEKQSLNITCIVLHDVDLIPENDGNLYTCERNHPKHTTIQIQKLNSTRGYTRFYEFLVGGVLILTFDMYKKFNGFSNLYWGWGGEDDDLALRLIQEKMCIVRSTYESALYTALPHPTGKRNSARYGLLTWSTLRMHKDGYVQIEQLTRIVNVEQTTIATHMKLDVDANSTVKFSLPLTTINSDIIQKFRS